MHLVSVLLPVDLLVPLGRGEVLSALEIVAELLESLEEEDVLEQELQEQRE